MSIKMLSADNVKPRTVATRNGTTEEPVTILSHSEMDFLSV